MTMNPLPPQAYTKDTLTKAYLWLLNQNDSIKEIATTPDVLVTLYLKAQRNGDDSLDTPSIQNFKNELKSLAGMMGELEKPNGNGVSQASPLASTRPPSANSRTSTATMPPFSGAPTSSASPASTFSNSSSLNGASMSATSSSTPPPSSATGFVPPTQTPPYPQQQQQTAYSAPSSQTAYTSAPEPRATYAQSSLPIEIIAQLDAKSRAMVAEVREQLNLGSDVEVLRLLISLGYKKARNLYS